MPIFQADLDSGSRERAALDVGPVSPRLRRQGLVNGAKRSDVDGTATSDRSELIERLKRGESPTWIPNRLARARQPVPRLQTEDTSPPLDSILFHSDDASPATASSTGLLPPAQLKSSDSRRLRDGNNIERPGSALHTGDFTHDHFTQGHDRPRSSVGRVARPDKNSTQALGSWISTSPPRDFAPFRFEHRRQLTDSAASFASGPSPLSSSLSSSFAYQPPTSPLVQSESNDDFDFSLPMSLVQRESADLGFAASPFASPAAASAWRQAERRRDSLPYQAHQPRRCLTTTPSFPQHGSSPQTPAMLRSRRPSLGSDLSPIQHASMVGSYEESILRGRMSTTPSKPFDFLAQIGVLGKGKCRSSLRCPSHVTLPFPAVYYSYGGTASASSRDDDGPSPYVGQIDLENGLPSLDDESRSRRKLRSRFLDRGAAAKAMAKADGDGDTDTAPTGTEPHSDRRFNKRRRSVSPRAPPGGSYRIPEKGQVQIVIKNQNKTAVKLFLVPYDLTGMEAGTKTFIRQRSYSAGPIIAHEPKPRDDKRPMLRYLVHLHICCPSRGRFYLYKSIRVVFANRCPDGKEKLRNDTTWPEPRFSPYKPIRLMHPPASLSAGPAALLASEKALRRRSLGISFGSSSLSSPSARASSSSVAAGNTLPVDPLAFRLTPPFHHHSDSDVLDLAPQSSLGSSSRPSSSTTTTAGDDDPDVSSPMPPPPPWGVGRYEKLSRGDVGYGGYGPDSPPPSGATEGLLSMRLRSFNIQNRPDDE
ncbi:hypothetical protein XA68_14049 [Ophiocordyceps unilateralis]|uniref:Atos-like conserved domain-containing protein n=1 Tax=Ophiocordyceps unilateralis TaxID=268505 RepID=A0A2A9P9T7_OPHUN|nr:hypothetical protein XA68_14049 [Ophiocordyceps unilateralis]